MNEINVIGYGIIIYDDDYDYFEGFIKEFNLAHDTNYDIFYDQYDEIKPIFVCKTGLIKFKYESFALNELQNEVEQKDIEHFDKIRSIFDEDEDTIILKQSWYIYNYLS